MTDRESKEEKLRIDVDNYINPIKIKAYRSLYMLSHPVLNKNPYTSIFHHLLYSRQTIKKPSVFQYVKSIILFYVKNLVNFIFYIFVSFVERFFYKSKHVFSESTIIVDSFLLVDKVIKSGKFDEMYFKGLEEILKTNSNDVIYMPRLYGHKKQMKKIKYLFKVLNKDKHDFIFEYSYLGIFDYLKLFYFICVYPVYHFSVKQKVVKKIDKYFNYSVVMSLSNVSFESYARYLFAKKLSSKISDVKILSWCEFQEMEKYFYKAINESNTNIKVYGCQFLIQYKMYQSMFIDEIDKELGIAPNKVLTNGPYYSKQANQANGVSLRYKELFEFQGRSKKANNNVVLLSYDIEESRNMLKLLEFFEEPLLLKFHPATNINQFNDLIKPEWKSVNESIYVLFQTAKMIFVAPMSGTAIEAVSLGFPVIICSSSNSFLMNPLCEVGKGVVWDYVFSKDQLMKSYNALIEFQFNEEKIVNQVSQWYKDNFFIEPTRVNIMSALEMI
jgi:hypothetical protein